MNQKPDQNNHIKNYATSLYQRLGTKWQSLTGNSPTDIRLGLWGTAGSGKTVYLASLFQELVSSPEWLLECNDEACEYINKILEFLEEGNFPPPNPKGHLDIYEYRLTGQSGAVKDFSITLLFIDAPGEFYENPREGNAQVKGETDVLEYLKSCHGIIFLLDSERDSKLKQGIGGKKLRTLLLKLMQEFQKRSRSAHQDGKARRLQQYMAFCITKIDKKELWKQAESPEDLARDILGKNLYKGLHNNYCLKERLKFYGVSSVGRYQEGGTWKEAVKYPKEDDAESTNNPSPEASQGHQLHTPSIDDFISYDPAYEPQLQEEISSQQSSSSEDLDDEDFDMVSMDHNLQNQLPNSKKPTFDADRDLVPINVIAPIRWLIESIRANPPSLYKQKDTQNPHIQK